MSISGFGRKVRGEIRDEFSFFCFLRVGLKLFNPLEGKMESVGIKA